MENKKIYLTVKDYLVSQQTFGLKKDVKKDMLITFPKPADKELSQYYKSNKYHSHQNNKTSLLGLLYRFAQKFTIKNKVNTVEKFRPEKGKILDYGCGVGVFLEAMKNNGWDVTGLEPNADAQKILMQKHLLTIDKLEQVPDNTFDVITLWHVLEHVPNLEETISELQRILKQDGTLFVAVPNFRSFDAKFYKKFWAGYDAPRHLWHFSQKSVHALFNHVNMSVEDMKAMKLDSYYVSLLSEQNKVGFLNFPRALYIGYTSNRKAQKRFQYSSILYILKNNQKLF